MLKKYKILAIILTILMVISIIPLTASAEKLTSGTYRDITWTFDESTGTLTISGTGKMYDDVHSIYPTWHGYISSIESVVISEGVTTISDSAFCNNENIKNVSIADSVTDIGDDAFYNCTDLTNVVIGDGVTTIGYRAFYNCDGLTDVVIGKGVTVIDDYAFNACSNLKTVTIYNAVETIGEYSFNCPKLTDVYYFGTEAEWNAISKGSIIYGIITGTGLEKATIHFLGEETHECSYNAVVTPPTCTEQGYTTYKCSVCDKEKIDDYVDAVGHTYEKISATEPTCTKQGYTTYECSVCGDEENDDYVDAVGHTYEKISATEPTCTEQGYTTYTCTVCGDESLDYVDATGHTVENWEVLVQPTCYVNGSEKGTCSACGQEVTQTIKKLNHEWRELKIDFEPTCSKEGQKSKECSICGDKTALEKIPALGHTFGDWELADDAKCGEYGRFEQVCSICNQVNVMFAPVEHKYESAVTIPTCTEQGYTTYTCKCGDTYVADYVDVDANNHSYTSEITAPATHTSVGTTTFTCACGDTYTETIDKLADHTYNAVVTAPTCTEKGYTTYTCACGDSYVANYVNATGHTPVTAVEENYVAPTCTENGSKDVVIYCSVCDEEISRDTVVINATGHLDKHNDGICDVCDIQLCDHDCHKDGISGFFWRIINVFNMLFSLNKTCECGVLHY